MIKVRWWIRVDYRGWLRGIENCDFELEFSVCVGGMEEILLMFY